MRTVWFYGDNYHERMHDRVLVTFNGTPDHPAPPRELIFEHYRQAVLANMRGSGEPRDLDFDSETLSSSMVVFESGAGKEWLETKLADALAPHHGS